MSTTLTANATQTIVQNNQLIANRNDVNAIDVNHNQQHNNVMTDTNMNNKSIANNCNIQLNNLLTLPLNSKCL
jgi:hypothetical protein